MLFICIFLLINPEELSPENCSPASALYGPVLPQEGEFVFCNVPNHRGAKMSEAEVLRFLDGKIEIRKRTSQLLEKSSIKVARIDSQLERLDEKECLDMNEHFNCDKYNASIDAIESILLSFAAAGLLKEGEETDHAIQTTLDALAIQTTLDDLENSYL